MRRSSAPWSGTCRTSRRRGTCGPRSRRAGNRHNVTHGHLALSFVGLSTSKDREVAASVHADTPATRQASHNQISYPIHHSHGREPAGTGPASRSFVQPGAPPNGQMNRSPLRSTRHFEALVKTAGPVTGATPWVDRAVDAFRETGMSRCPWWRPEGAGVIRATSPGLDPSHEIRASGTVRRHHGAGDTPARLRDTRCWCRQGGRGLSHPQDGPLTLTGAFELQPGPGPCGQLGSRTANRMAVP